MHLDWRLLLMVERKATSSGDILGIYINIFQNSDSDHLLKNNLNKCNHCEQRGGDNCDEIWIFIYSLPCVHIREDIEILRRITQDREIQIWSWCQYL